MDPTLSTTRTRSTLRTANTSHDGNKTIKYADPLEWIIIPNADTIQITPKSLFSSSLSRSQSKDAGNGLKILDHPVPHRQIVPMDIKCKDKVYLYILCPWGRFKRHRVSE